MPTYEYECRKCGHRFEKFQPITAKPVKTCPRCRGRSVKKLISAGAGILLKGSGFYGTDYRSDNYKKGAKQEAESHPSESKNAMTASPEKPKVEAKKSGDKKEAKGGKKTEGKS
jgi:putative FmdB family regulatory protein